MSLAICTTCSKSFARNADLTRHMITHSRIKPHVCETCGKGFAQFSGLKTHRNTHTKAKPFICGINTCKKAFADPSSCTRHRKETHMLGGGPFKCFVPDCRTSIKRRSTFLTHLRKHGIDTDSEEVRKIIERTNQRRVPVPVQLASRNVENGGHYEGDPHGAPSSFLSDSSEYDVTGNRDETFSFTDNHGLPDDDPFDCRRAHWSTMNDAFVLNSDPHLASQVGPSRLAYDIYSYLYSDFGNQSCFDDIFLPRVDHSLATASPLNLPVLEPFLEAGSDGIQSSSSSPASTYSTLYSNDFNDDVVSLSLPNSAPQESLLYGIM